MLRYYYEGLVRLFIVVVIIFSFKPYGFGEEYFNASEDSLEIDSRVRLKTMVATGSVAYVGSLTGLYYLWYKDYPQSSFHFFNDNAEWLQMDKFCHATASYYMGVLGYNALNWAGASRNTSIWAGGFAGSFYLSIIEILDGFSEEWGFSYGDFIANMSGSLFFSVQQAMWDKQNVLLKYSFSPSPYAQYRPNLLGENVYQSALKDYNGITCWMSVNMKVFFEKNDAFPDWLCLSLGYSGDGMIGAKSNPSIYDGQMMPHFERQRQYFLSVDIDLNRLPVESKFLKATARVFSFIKMPLPTLEYNKSQGLKFHPIYF